MQIQRFTSKKKRVWSTNINRRNEIGLGRMIILEQLMLGSIAIVVGIGVGMLCSKLFFKR